MNNEVTFNIEVTMNERWVDDFCSMLDWMECCGNLGHSSIVGFNADGDDDFRPKFVFDRDFSETDGYMKQENHPLPEMEIMFDAG